MEGRRPIIMDRTIKSKDIYALDNLKKKQNKTKHADSANLSIIKIIIIYIKITISKSRQTNEKVGQT